MTKFKTKFIILIAVLILLFFAIPMPFIVDNSWGAKIYEISSADELFDMAEKFSSLPIEECNFKLTSDIDLGGKSWYGTGATSFRGVFDGNGHTVKNFKLASRSEDSETTFAFWTSVANAFIHDVTFENVNVEENVHNPLIANGVRAHFGLIGKASGGTIQNINLKNSNINIKAGQVIAGGIICQDTDNGLRVNIHLENNLFNLTSFTKETIFGGVSAVIESYDISYKICKARDNVQINQSGNRTAIVGGIIGKIEGEFVKIRELICSSVIEVNALSAKTGGLIGEINPRTVLNITDNFLFDGKISQNSTNV